MPTIHLSPDEKRSRRMKAARLFERGFTQAEVARRCGVSRPTALDWYRRWSKRGRSGLEPRPLGRPTKVPAAALKRLEKALLSGPRSQGFSTDLWTLERIAQVMERLSGVRYHPGHVWRLMREMGWSLQRPTTRARERDEKAIERWKKERWPELKKTPGPAAPSSS